ncbi:MAG: nucleotidyl transferase AbiEii/AbiGii toxin family protein [Ignavibacteria bacterium]|nr:nucleotidyl transferase AbiEii/AbiGii toxin family protein [Ignavibacteria bacterium]
MNQLEEYYSANLYPFQDGILNIVKELNIPFYLTGGTALSRHYFQHRYSDDLDLFVNNDSNFEKYVETFYKSLGENGNKYHFEIDFQRIRRTEFYAQFFLIKNNIELKIDLINDVADHYGDFQVNKILGKVDSLRNILSNKLTALFRYEVKDIADIRVICKNYKCNFREIVEEAKTKEAGVDPIAIYEILSSFPADKINLIKWVKEPEAKIFETEIKQIAEDVLYGRENSLFVK